MASPWRGSALFRSWSLLCQHEAHEFVSYEFVLALSQILAEDGF